MSIPLIRHQHANDYPVREGGKYVLYWMIAQRRTRYNFALQHAVDRARQFGKPLVVFEPLRIRYRWASDRLHRFIIEGMRDNAADLAGKCATYLPYVEPQPGNGTPLLHELAKHAVTVVTDEYPCFFLPRMIRTVKDRIPARLELVDSNGVIPLRMPNRDFTVAHSFRRWMQKNILDLLLKFPEADPLAGEPLPKLRRLPASVTDRWQPADLDHLLTPGGLGRIPIDHDVTICPETPGGSAEAESRLERFLSSRLEHYGDLRNHPDEHATTELSPHLHFGHIAAHEIVQRLLDHESWTPDQASAPNGKNHSFWNTSGPAEAFLDQILTWREIGFNEAFRHPDTYDKLSSLPQWAQNSLRETAGDPRPYLYSLDQLEHAETHDDLWNAAQREIVQTGMMHNYMRMLWGKKILQWTESPQQALDFMIHLNNKYGLDGRDPNSYCGILWVLGRTDRAWGPKRPVYGAVRYMTSESAQTKLKLKKYLRRFGS